jgi:hypothetical protein
MPRRLDFKSIELTIARSARTMSNKITPGFIAAPTRTPESL